MRLLILSRYGHMGASSRVRFEQYIPHLMASGMQVTLHALLDDPYLMNLYARRRRNLGHLLRLYFRRLRSVLEAGQFDLVWLEKECWPWMPRSMDPGLLRRRTRYVVDYDDAIFHNYDQHRSTLVRRIFGTKIDDVMRHAALVMAGNRYLAARATAARAQRIEILPTVVDLTKFQVTPRESRRGVVVGWIGSPSTQHLLEPLVPVLQAVLDPAHDTFATIGANLSAPLLANHRMIPWSEAREAADIMSFDIGVMPLVDQPWERGKCGFKLIQYMAAGLPVVASPVGVNVEIVRHGLNGFLADSPASWTAALAKLRSDPALRERMGAVGRAEVEERYSLQIAAPRVVQLLREAAAIAA